MSNIPFAREILKSALEVDDISDVRAYISSALKYMTREKYTRKAASTSNIVTQEVKTMVRYYAMENPDASMQSIGNMFRVNPGRVSEILAGKI
jgi:glycine cleavage system pyridoxal-binding protein P